MTTELWKRIQEGMGYTDEEIAIVKADPYRSRVLEAGPVLVRRKIIGEVIEAKNCAAHSAGTKYVIRANGVLRPQENPGNLCLSLLAALAPTAQVIFDRIAKGDDPKGKFVYYVHCPDVGVECGGFGRALLKVTVE